jgi:hypothetical protein
MKSNSPVRWVTVAFACSLLAAYVVYAQHLQAPITTPSSKKSDSAAGIVTGTNKSARAQPMVAPGSKRLVPVISIP